MTSRSSTKHSPVTMGILATVMVFSVLGLAHAQKETTPALQKAPAQQMGPMQQQMMQGMMHQMQNCMAQMGQAHDAPRQQMRAQMMGRMQSCMEQMQSSEQQDEDKPEN